VYKRWLFADVRPGLQWQADHDYELGYRVEVGFDMLFWGAGYQ
jgi:hypothetical protein